MEIALPDRLHGHQHRTLDDAVFQGWDTQWAFLAIGFRDIDAPDRLRTVIPAQQVRAQADQSCASPACIRCLSIPSMPGVWAPLDANTIRAASASHA
jgi:hypothetical protein